MKRRNVVMAGILAAGTAAALLGACEVVGEPLPKAWWLSVESASYCVENATVKLSLPAGMVGTLEFKDAQGVPVGPPAHIEGGGAVELPVPAGATTYDWKVTDAAEPLLGPGSGLLASQPPPFATSSAPATTLVHRAMPSVFFMGCSTAKFDLNAVSYAYALSARSDDADDAYSMMQDVLDGKVGTAVDPAVTVDAFIELSIDNGRARLVTSLPAEFESYAVHLGGSTVADLAAGFNAAVAHRANGWVSITSVLPLSVVHVDSALHLSQKAAGAAEGATLVIG